MTQLNISYSVDPREIRARLDTQAVRILLERGYPIDLVKEALEIQMRSQGTQRNW